MNNYTELLNQIKTSKTISFEDVFNKSFSFFKKSWYVTLVLFLLFLGIYFFLSIFLVFPILLSKTNLSLDNDLPLSLIFILFFAVIGILLLICVFFGFISSLFLIYKKIDCNENYTISDWFTFIKPKYFTKTLTLSLTSIGFIILGMLLCYFPYVYLSIPVSLFSVFYAFNPHLTTSEIIKLSFEFGNKNWIILFLLNLVLGFIASFGALLCGIGILATLGLVFIEKYIAYRDTLGFAEDWEVEKIGLKEEY